MNTLKRTLALVATLAMASTAFVACGDDKSDSTPATTAPATTAPATQGETQAPTEDKPAEGGNSQNVGEVKLPTNGDKFNVVSWDNNDCPKLIKLWAETTGKSESDANFVDLMCKGGEAAAKFDQRFASDENTDVFFVEADWALRFVNDDKTTVALDQLGFTEDNWKDAYAYTLEIARATSGANAGKLVGASWQAAAGGFAYRTDLAEQYLGVKSADDMQTKIGDWDKFAAAAKEVYTKSEGKVNLADSLGGMWQVYAANRKAPWVSGTRVNFDDQCKAFAELAKDLWTNGGVAHVSQWNEGWEQGGIDGSTMGYFVSTWGVGDGQFFGNASSSSRGKWNMIQGPASYFWGGTWMVVHPGCDNADLAQSFIKACTVDQAAMKKYATSKPEFVNNKTAMSEVIGENLKIEFATDNFDGQNYFKVLDENVKTMDLKGLITPYDATIKGIFLGKIQDEYCTGNMSYDEAISEALKKVQADVPELAGNA